MEPFIGMTTIFAGNFNPRGWGYCNGALLPINQNSALFSILGTTYGGDGRTTFALPDLRGRCVRGSEGNSAGPGLAPVQLGQRGGSVSHILTVGQMPNHFHTVNRPVSSSEGLQDSPVNNVPAAGENENLYNTAPTANNSAQQFNTNPTGGNQSFDILNPFLGMNYIIALQGTFPSRN